MYSQKIQNRPGYRVSTQLKCYALQIVFPDCDLDAAVAGLVRSSFLNQGEICLCTSRIFVHSDILEPFLHRFVPAVAALKVGDPEEEETFCGAVNSKQHFEKVKFTENKHLNVLIHAVLLNFVADHVLHQTWAGGRCGGALWAGRHPRP